MWLQLRYSGRHLRRRPVVALITVLSLAIGIGCALACASVVNTVIFRALPYPNSDELVLVWENNTKRGVGLTPSSSLNYQDLRAASTCLSQLGAFADIDLSLDGPTQSERVVAYKVSQDVLTATNVQPLLGRAFSHEEDQATGANVTILSHRLWRGSFGQDRDILGRSVRLSGIPYTVVGVMPEGFNLPPAFTAQLVGSEVAIREADLWIPLRPASLPQRRGFRDLFLLGRLKSSCTLQQTQAEASAIGNRLATTFPDVDFGMDFSVVPFQREVVRNVQTLLVVLVFVGGLVLVIGATNGANLLLLDALDHLQETSLRSALGETTWHFSRQLFLTNAILCALGTMGGLLLMMLIRQPIATYARANVPRLDDVRLDATMIFLAVLLALGLAVVMTLVTLVAAGPTRLDGRNVYAVSNRRYRVRRLLLVAEVAIAIVIMSTAGLLIKSSRALSSINPGFTMDSVSVLEFMLPETTYGSSQRRIEVQRQLLDAFNNVPYFRTAAVADFIPFGGNASILTVTIENHTPRDEMHQPQAARRAVSASYFTALSIPLLKGRFFTSHDDGDSTNVAIINDTFARTYAPTEDLLGRRIRIGNAGSTSPWMLVVGVVGSTRSAGLALEPQAELFVPYTHDGTQTTTNLIVKGLPNRPIKRSELINTLYGVDPALHPTRVDDMQDLVSRSIGQPSFYAGVFSLLAAIALVLTLAGVYGVNALAILARSKDLAVRMCLGAQTADILHHVVSELFWALACGLIVGAGGAFLIQQLMSPYVYGISTGVWFLIVASASMVSVSAVGSVLLAAIPVVRSNLPALLKQGGARGVA